MALKRSRDPEASGTVSEQKIKKQKKGFSVGPDHLPDGTYRRRVQKIKRNLIDKAKVRKEYAKLKQKHKLEQNHEENQEAGEKLGMHPERVSMIATAGPDVEDDNNNNVNKHGGRSVTRQPLGHRTRPWQKPHPFGKEQAQAKQRSMEIEARKEARLEAMRQREQKLEERERFRRAMAKARTGGRNGQRKLGRESTVLLEKVQRMVGH